MNELAGLESEEEIVEPAPVDHDYRTRHTVAFPVAMLGRLS